MSTTHGTHRYGTALPGSVFSGPARWEIQAAALLNRRDPNGIAKLVRELPGQIATLHLCMPAAKSLRFREEIAAANGSERPVLGLNRDLRLTVAREDSEADLARYAYEADPSEANRRRLVRELEEDVAVKLTYLRELRAKGE